MFDNERYITKGIKEKISSIIYLILWQMIDEMELEKRDYLQVFDLRVSDEKEGLMEIIHSQEELHYKQVCEFYTNFKINALAYVVKTDDGHSTMLLADEL